MKVFAAANSNPEVRATSSAGGVFSILAEKILDESGVVYGAAFDKDWKVTHKRIDNVGDLDSLRRSKYAYSHIGTTIQDAFRDLEAGKKVLFSSTPCQVAAMRKMAGDHPNLLCVEVVCHGAPEPKYWEKYLAEVCQKLKREVADIESINFRDKRTGWKNYSFAIRFKDGKEFTQLHDDNLYMRAFLSDYTLRDACFDCKFKYPEGTRADITLGDLWGITQIAPEIDNDLGTTLVIARTPKGESYLSLLPLEKELNLASAIRYNPAISSSPQKPKNLDSFRRDFLNKKILKILKNFTSKSIRVKLHKIKRILRTMLNR